jgi:hypothetical protein
MLRAVWSLICPKDKSRVPLPSKKENSASKFTASWTLEGKQKEIIVKTIYLANTHYEMGVFSHGLNTGKYQAPSNFINPI